MKTFEPGDAVKLKCRSRIRKGSRYKANTILIAFGPEFKVHSVEQTVEFSELEGPWYLVTTKVGSGHERFIHHSQDRLFSLEKADG